MPYTVYILHSNSSQCYYIGYTADIGRRLEEHNTNQSRYTSRKGPCALVYSETYDLKSDAIRRERFLKKQRNHAFYQRLIDSQRKN
jgi:putative endonuclease